MASLEEVPVTRYFLFFFGGSMNTYIYEGPVMEFERCITDRWKATTMAASENKARSNFAYQYKKTNNKLPTAKISLPGKVSLIQ